MGSRPRAQIIIDPPIPVPSNPTPSACTATDDPPPITGTVPATRRVAQPRLPRSNVPPKKPACPGSPRTSISARVKPSVTRSPSPGLMASTSSSVHVSTHSNAASSMPPTMDWSVVDRSRNNGKKTSSVVSRKSSVSSSFISNRSSCTARFTPDKSGQIVSITGLPAKFNTAKALATEAEQLGIAVQDIRIGRTSSTLRSTDPRLLSKLSALSDVVNARLTLKIPHWEPSTSADGAGRSHWLSSCWTRTASLYWASQRPRHGIATSHPELPAVAEAAPKHHCGLRWCRAGSTQLYSSCPVSCPGQPRREHLQLVGATVHTGADPVVVLVHYNPPQMRLSRRLIRHVASLPPSQRSNFDNDFYDTTTQLTNNILATRRDTTVQAIDIDEVVDAVAQCVKKTAPGPDGIRWVHLRQLSTKSLSALRAVYNECLRRDTCRPRGRLPLSLCCKTGQESSDPSSYRPISLLNTMAKTLERIIAKRLTTWCEANDILPNTQYGFRRGYSTADPVVKLHSCAVDSISVGRVRVGVELSASFTPAAGVPQGSVLSPLLYALSIDIDEVVDAVAQCVKKTAPGPDGIRSVHLRQLSTKSLSALRAVYNECLRRRHMPTAWKTATVIMLHKRGKNPSDPSSYRPISLLNTMAKTLERIIAKRLTTWCEANDILPNTQYGFRRGYSTQTRW
ncbi:hypothetical protein CBL_05214 [Carabus blaptoides fortunei]